MLLPSIISVHTSDWSCGLMLSRSFCRTTSGPEAWATRQPSREYGSLWRHEHFRNDKLVSSRTFPPCPFCPVTYCAWCRFCLIGCNSAARFLLNYSAVLHMPLKLEGVELPYNPSSAFGITFHAEPASHLLHVESPSKYP